MSMCSNDYADLIESELYDVEALEMELLMSSEELMALEEKRVSEHDVFGDSESNQYKGASFKM